MTRNEYKRECLVLRDKLKATGRDYLSGFLDYWFMNVIGEDRDRYRRDLQSFLRGSAYVHGTADPYRFFDRIDKYLKYHEKLKKSNERRALHT